MDKFVERDAVGSLDGKRIFSRRLHGGFHNATSVFTHYTIEYIPFLPETAMIRVNEGARQIGCFFKSHIPYMFLARI